ncbi:hypothetical protein AYI70_g4096 [Smittium culicis]|uniref:Uncharacterized protein n=1 Tax=Smittium culicis TaxID=133412 RepID=A0A1R1Y0P1_9FUNG|nr:hypothetical protein AYI70_g4096 [Smittium culicis]
MTRLSSSLNDLYSATVKKTDTIMLGIQINIDQTNRPIEFYDHHRAHQNPQWISVDTKTVPPQPLDMQLYREMIQNSDKKEGRNLICRSDGGSRLDIDMNAIIDVKSQRIGF